MYNSLPNEKKKWNCGSDICTNAEKLYLARNRIICKQRIVYATPVEKSE